MPFDCHGRHMEFGDFAKAPSHPGRLDGPWIVGRVCDVLSTPRKADECDMSVFFPQLGFCDQLVCRSYECELIVLRDGSLPPPIVVVEAEAYAVFP